MRVRQVEGDALTGDADIIVVGAGPAGSAAAIAAARLGRRVLLLDRARFPRDKPCGDLIGARALRFARSLGIDEAVVAPFPPLDGVTITTTSGDLALSPTTALGQSIVRRSDARIIPRQTFDAAMVAAAIRAGVALDVVQVRSVVFDEATGMRVVRGVASRQPVELRAPVVVVAGGYGCRLAADVIHSSAVRGRERPHGIAMRGYFRHSVAPPRAIIFSLDEWVLPGYGWVFPLPNGLANIGIGTLVGGDHESSEHLHDLFRRYVGDVQSPIAEWVRDAEMIGKARSWALDLGPRPRTVCADGLLVAGEAAGLVGPMTGAGIAFALESGMRAGQVAAKALLNGETSAAALRPYSDWIRRRPLRWLQVEDRAHRLVSDPRRLRRVVSMTRALPVTPTLGAKLLLNLG